MRWSAGLVVFLALAVPPTAADHCAAYETSAADVDIDLGLERFYLLHEPCFSCPLPSAFFLYQEGNEIAGLQRHDGFVNDTCHGVVEADTLLAGPGDDE